MLYKLASISFGMAFFGMMLAVFLTIPLAVIAAVMESTLRWKQRNR